MVKHMGEGEKAEIGRARRKKMKDYEGLQKENQRVTDLYATARFSLTNSEQT